MPMRLRQAYQKEEISNLMDGETWFDKNKAIEMGFVMELLLTKGKMKKLRTWSFKASSYKLAFNKDK